MFQAVALPTCNLRRRSPTTKVVVRANLRGPHRGAGAPPCSKGPLRAVLRARWPGRRWPSRCTPTAPVEHHLLGASPFPRHWVYDTDGKLMKKSGLIDFSTWYRNAFGKHSPWGDQDSPALATEVETALERQLSPS